MTVRLRQIDRDIRTQELVLNLELRMPRHVIDDFYRQRGTNIDNIASISEPFLRDILRHYLLSTGTNYREESDVPCNDGRMRHTWVDTTSGIGNADILCCRHCGVIRDIWGRDRPVRRPANTRSPLTPNTPTFDEVFPSPRVQVESISIDSPPEPTKQPQYRQRKVKIGKPK